MFDKIENNTNESIAEELAMQWANNRISLSMNEQV